MTDFYEELRKEALAGKKWCYDCIHHRSGTMCGYESHECKIYGSLDMDQRERHPDVTADSCPDYKQRDGDRWYDRQQKHDEEIHQMCERARDYYKERDEIKAAVMADEIIEELLTLEDDELPIDKK